MTRRDETHHLSTRINKTLHSELQKLVEMGKKKGTERSLTSLIERVMWDYVNDQKK